jgi:hypothetical protein
MMIFGNPTEIAFTYEVLHRQANSHFAFGIFNIFIDDKLLLSGGSNWTIDCIVGHFRNTKKLEVIDDLEVEKEILFSRACSTRGYLSDSSPKIDPQWWASDDPLIVKKVDAYLAEIEAMRSDPPFGVELPLYSELVDSELRIFFFASENAELIIYNCDLGKTIGEKRIPRGTVRALIESLPEVV